jgi:hypothetical protein
MNVACTRRFTAVSNEGGPYIHMRRSSSMRKAIVLASALLIGGATFGIPAETALGAEAKSADAIKKAECKRDATLQLYVGKQRSRFLRQCLASRGRSTGKPVARPRVLPSVPTAMPRQAPLGGTNPRNTSTGSTLPSNAPVAPSAPVIGSTGTSTTGLVRRPSAARAAAASAALERAKPSRQFVA